MKVTAKLKLILTLTILCLALLTSLVVKASDHPWRDEDKLRGYSEDLKPENEDTGEILYSVENPYRNEIQLSERIFDPALKKDITQRYQERFGRTEAEIIQARTPYLNSNFSEGASITFNEEDYQKQQQSFGNYVVKRVVEYHFEKETRENPDLRGVYETKQKLENVSASIGQFKLRGKYRIASNSVIIYIKNPYIDIEARYEMSGDRETVYSLSKDFPKGYSFLTDYYIGNLRWDIIGRKVLTAALSVSITYSPFKRVEVAENTRTIEIDEQSAIAGLTYAF